MEVEVEPFFKAIVIKPDIFKSQIMEEHNFVTMEEAKRFQMETLLNHNNLMCVICNM